MCVRRTGHTRVDATQQCAGPAGLSVRRARERRLRPRPRPHASRSSARRMGWALCSGIFCES
eukprot:2555084-Prymnesium_polylepis.1